MVDKSPAIFHHSSGVWGIALTSIFAFVHTKAPLAKFVFEKSRIACLGNVISFLISHTAIQ